VIDRLRYLYPSVAALLAVAITVAGAQTTSKAGSKFYVMTGVVTGVSASSLTVGRGQNEMMFGVDASTRLVTTRTTAGKGDLVYRERRVTDLVEPGDRVRVTYRRSGSVMSAVEVRVAQK